MIDADSKKNYFSDYAILTVHGIIVSNALVFIHKVRYFSKSLPKSICQTIATNSPLPGSTYISCQPWLAKYENNIYTGTLSFTKGLCLLPVET